MDACWGGTLEEERSAVDAIVAGAREVEVLGLLDAAGGAAVCEADEATRLRPGVLLSHARREVVSDRRRDKYEGKILAAIFLSLQLCRPCLTTCQKISVSVTSG